MDEEIRLELLDRIKHVYDMYSTKRVLEIVDIFKREFGEENVDYNLTVPVFETFARNFSSNFALYNTPSGDYKLCSNSHAQLLHWDLLYDISDQEAWEDIPMEEAFETINEDDVFNHFRQHFNHTSYIYVHFPLTKVSNERGQFTLIKDLFAKVEVTTLGNMTPGHKFRLNRSHFTYAHFVHNYLHSHVGGIPYDNHSEFQDCCTGEGPINETMSNLWYNDYSEAEWIQFCWDLAKYVTVESEEGGPYFHLKKCDSPYIKGREYCITNLNVSLDSGTVLTMTHYTFPDNFWNNFLKCLVENKVPKFRWANKQWEIAEFPTDYMTKVSNAFLQYCKDNVEALQSKGISVGTLLEKEVLVKCIVDITGVFRYDGEAASSTIENSRGKHVITFRGVEYNVVIEDKPEDDSTKIQVLLNPRIIAYLTGCLLKVLNTEYGKRDEDIPAEPEIPFGDF